MQLHKMIMLLCVHVTRVLFLVLAGNFALTMHGLLLELYALTLVTRSYALWLFIPSIFFVACTAIILGCSLDRCVNQEFSSFLITFCMYYQSFIMAVRITACLMLLSNQNLNNTKCECASNKKSRSYILQTEQHSLFGFMLFTLANATIIYICMSFRMHCNCSSVTCSRTFHAKL